MTKKLILGIGALLSLLGIYALGFTEHRHFHCHDNGVCHTHEGSETGHTHELEHAQ